MYLPDGYRMCVSFMQADKPWVLRCYSFVSSKLSLCLSLFRITFARPHPRFASASTSTNPPFPATQGMDATG
jgi:hypothetical protein